MANDDKYLALYMRSQAERLRAMSADLEKWASDLEQTADKLCPLEDGEEVYLPRRQVNLTAKPMGNA